MSTSSSTSTSRPPKVGFAETSQLLGCRLWVGSVRTADRTADVPPESEANQGRQTMSDCFGAVSDLWLARLQRGGVAVLLVMMSVALFNDVARLLGLH